MIIGFHVSSSEMHINKEDGKKKILPGIKDNQLLKAKVLKLLPQGNAQLLINNQKIVAKTPLLMKPGEDIQLKVLSHNDDIILKFMGPVQKMTSNQISSLIGFFAKNESIPDLTGIKNADIDAALYDMALKSDEPDKNFLPKLIEKSGMIWEKKVADTLIESESQGLSTSDLKERLEVLLKHDIKGNILKTLFQADPGEFKDLKDAKSFSDTVENFQMLNHNSSDTGRFLLPFPILNDGTFNFGQVLINMGEKNEDEDRKDADKLIRLSFLLDMSRLGPLRADFSIFKEEINGRFLLQDEDTREYVESMIPELKTRLAGIDYHVHQIECLIAEQRDIQPGSLIETLVQSSDDTVLNIVI